jgi:hypothetical protein
MPLRKIFFAVCLIVSALCLAAGYGIVGQWIGAVLAIIAGFAWLLARKYPASGLPHICLFASIGLAVTGSQTGASSLLMIYGSGVSLGVWDLLFLNIASSSNPADGQTRRYENEHLLSLALALGSGLLVASLGHFLKFQIPFVLLLLFVVLAIFGLDRIWGYLKKRSTHISSR